MGALDGLTILVPESRELDLFAGMLEAQGATALRCPLVQIADLDDTTEAVRWIDIMIAAPFDFTVFLTGEGVRKLLSLSGERRDALIKALGKTQTITRGPKPARALREIGLLPTIAAAAPTSQSVLESLEKERLPAKTRIRMLIPTKTRIRKKGPKRKSRPKKKNRSRVFLRPVWSRWTIQCA
jgi:uroporphyrinogen-III synthase